MSEPGTDMDHTDRLYLWRANKGKQRVHIEDLTTGRTHCQTENVGGRPLDGRSAKVPTGRRLCQNCTDLEGRDESSYAEPDVRVLLGERMVEAEPELFASTMAPKPERTDLTYSDHRKKWKRGKQARRVNRPRQRKPGRSTVKHDRPFDDDLPW